MDQVGVPSDSAIPGHSDGIGTTIDNVGEYWLSNFLDLELNETLWAQTLPPPTESPQATSTDAIPTGTAQANTLRKAKNPQIAEDVWEQHFPIISQLFDTAEYKEIIEQLKKDGFAPSIKQLKTRVRFWQTRGRLPWKKIPQGDMDTMVLVAHLRQKFSRVQTVFTYYGTPVPPEKVQKHERRFGVKQRAINLKQVPPHIVWHDSEPPEIKVTTASTLPSEQKDTPKPNLTRPTLETEVCPINSSPQATSSRTDPSYFPNQAHSTDSATDAEMRDARLLDGATSCVPTYVVDRIHGFKRQITPNTASRKLAAPLTAESLRARLEPKNKPDSKPFKPDFNPDFNPTQTSEQVSTSLQYTGMLREVDRRPISQEQLASEIKSIYAGLTMVETKCIHVQKAQTSGASREPLTSEHWQALIALHRTLLHEHHDFLLASQHPSASPAMRRLASKYAMPARMWKHGINSFLMILRARLPESLDYMLAFIYLAYQLIALLYETVPSFRDTWVECLGDLARYRMAIEDEDVRDREVWCSSARRWYTLAAEAEPGMGRLYHHLAILSRPNILQQLFHYTRSLTSCRPFLSARESILTSFERVDPTLLQGMPPTDQFVGVHVFALRQEYHKACGLLGEALGRLDADIVRVSCKWKEQGAYVASVNIASLFDYGASTSLRYTFDVANHLNSLPNSEEAKDCDLPENLKEPVFSCLTDSESYALQCDLFSKTLETVSARKSDPNVLPYLHLTLAFLVSLAEAQKASDDRIGTTIFDAQFLADAVPWGSVCGFLNKLASTRGQQDQGPISVFPLPGEPDSRPLPEDYLMRGQVWTQDYFPAHWFGEVDEEEKELELSQFDKVRTDRILWLGRNLALHGCVSYDHERSTFHWVPPPAISAEVEMTSLRPRPECWEHGCNGRRFATFSNLLRHQREMSGTAAKSYCPWCGAEFTRTTVRNGHMHSGKCPRYRKSELSHFDMTMYERRLTDTSNTATTPRSRATSQAASTGSTPPSSVSRESSKTDNCLSACTVD